MAAETVREEVLAQLSEIAPEADLDALDPDAALREELELDSLDFQRLIAALDDVLGIEVPERDYGRLTTLRTLTDYLDARSSQPGA